jgi:hypothetical protein
VRIPATLTTASSTSSFTAGTIPTLHWTVKGG